MPTGTGKTDTMLALLISGKMERTLILVPSDALRSQLVRKCENFKTLRSVGAVSESALNPVVCSINSGMTEKDVLNLSKANVIVATPQALRLFNGAAMKALGDMCSHLFVVKLIMLQQTVGIALKRFSSENHASSLQQRHLEKIVWL